MWVWNDSRFFMMSRNRFGRKMCIRLRYMHELGRAG